MITHPRVIHIRTSNILIIFSISHRFHHNMFHAVQAVPNHILHAIHSLHTLYAAQFVQYQMFTQFYQNDQDTAHLFQSLALLGVL